MSGNYGFVFDQGRPPTNNTGYQQTAAYPSSAPQNQNPFQDHNHIAQPYPQPPSYSSTGAAAAQQKPPNFSQQVPPYPTHPLPPTYGHQGQYPGGAVGYPPLPQQNPPNYYGGHDHVVRGPPADAQSHGNSQQKKDGILGGKLGVLGGAAAAGVGTSLALQMLPSKLKKNKLVKYGLPLAGAGAAGYKLDQMNNGGKSSDKIQGMKKSFGF